MSFQNFQFNLGVVNRSTSLSSYFEITLTNYPSSSDLSEYLLRGYFTQSSSIFTEIFVNNY